MSVATAQREISSLEFTEWMAFDCIDPIGQERGDLHAAMVVAAVTAPNLPRGRTVTAEQYMPDFEEGHKPRQSVSQMAATMAMFAAGHNARKARSA